MNHCENTSVYRGVVESNEDPENMGRLKIRCAPLYGDTVPDYWAFPRGMMAGAGHGVFWIPTKGDPIYVTCINGDARFPLWEYGWYMKEKAPSGAQPKVKLFLTPGGHRVELNDDNNTIDVKHPSGFHVKIHEDGIYLGKGSDNLGKFIDDLFQLLVTTTVPTIYGASAFNNLTEYQNLKTKITQFLKLAE